MKPMPTLEQRLSTRRRKFDSIAVLITLAVIVSMFCAPEAHTRPVMEMVIGAAIFSLFTAGVFLGTRIGGDA